MPVVATSVPAMLGEQARQRPNARAYTFVDYELDPLGFAESLTWSEVHKPVQVVANELASCGSPGDRAAILAPQGLGYIVGLLGAMTAGFIAPDHHKRQDSSLGVCGTVPERRTHSSGHHMTASNGLVEAGAQVSGLLQQLSERLG